jgi:hypothetical protein
VKQIVIPARYALRARANAAAIVAYRSQLGTRPTMGEAVALALAMYPKAPEPQAEESVPHRRWAVPIREDLAARLPPGEGLGARAAAALAEYASKIRPL